MALGLLFVIVAALTTLTGYCFSLAGIISASPADTATLLVIVMIDTSLYERHSDARWKANACRR